MAVEAISCGNCSWPVAVEFWNRDTGVRCPGCGQRVEVAVFPAIDRARSGALPETVIVDTEASCFYHPENRAAVPCDECGRFLCHLCDIEIDGRHLCPVCFQSGVATNRLETIEVRRTMYDTVALAFATFPALLFWPVIFGAPAALFITFRRWRSPGSIVPRTRMRFYLAALFAVAEIVGVIFLIWAFMRLPGRRA